MKYGLQLYTMRNELSKKENLKGLFCYLSSIGIENVELACMPKMTDLKIREAAEKCGIKVISSHSDFGKIKNHIDSLIREHFVYGANIIGIGGMPAKYRKNLKSLKKFTDIFNRSADEAAKYGMKLCYHNHAFEFEKIEGKVIFDFLLENLNENVCFCVDCYWADYAGQDVTEIIEKTGHRTAILHFKDSSGAENGKKILPLGSGVLKFKDYIAVGEKFGTEYALIELDESENPRADVKKSIDFLKTLEQER